MSVEQVAPRPAPHHPSCPARAGYDGCICPVPVVADNRPLDDLPCPDCTGVVTVWRAYAIDGWAEWLVCRSCLWRELL